MAQGKKVSRKDNKGRVLRKGESQRKDGTYMYRYQDERKKRCCVYAKTLSDLREKALQIERDRMNNIRISSKNITVQQLVKTYMELNKSWAINTRTHKQQAYGKHIENSWLGLKKVSEVGYQDILLYYTDLTNILSNTSIKTIHSLLRPSFEMALRDNMIRYNPTVGVMKHFPDDTKEKKPYNEDEIQRLLTFMQNKKKDSYEKMIPVTVFILQTMVRIGELAALTWNDIDFKNKIIYINKQVIYQKKDDHCRYFISPPKTECGKRVIPMTNAAYQALLMQKQIIQKYNYRTDYELDGYRGFIFTLSSGKPVHSKKLDTRFKVMVSNYNQSDDAIKYGILPHLSCHILRHTGCSIFAKIFYDKGLDIKILQKWMGHSTLKMTLSVYNHVRENDEKKALYNINTKISETDFSTISSPILLDCNK